MLSTTLIANVGNDVDAEGLTCATVTITSGPQLLSADCSFEQDIFDVVNNQISFCILSLELSLTIQFLLEDDAGGIDSGTIVLTAQLPIETITTTNVIAFENGSTVGVPGTDLVQSEIFENNEILITIVEELNFDDLIGFIFTANLVVLITSPVGVFNAFEGSPFGADGVPIGDCAQNERINGFCPFGFTYTATVGSFVTEQNRFTLIINAVDDFGPEILLLEDSVTVLVKEDANSAQVSLPSIRIISDNDESVFNVKLSVSTSSDISIVLDPKISLNSLILVSNKIGVNGNFVDNCFNFPCQSVDLETTPAQINTILAELTVRIDLTQDTSGSKVFFRLVAGTEEIRNEIRIEVEEVKVEVDESKRLILMLLLTTMTLLSVVFVVFLTIKKVRKLEFYQKFG